MGGIVTDQSDDVTSPTNLRLTSPRGIIFDPKFSWVVVSSELSRLCLFRNLVQRIQKINAENTKLVSLETETLNFEL